MGENRKFRPWWRPAALKTFPAWLNRAIEEHPEDMEHMEDVDEFIRLFNQTEELGKYIWENAEPIIQDKIEEIRSELEDPGITAEQILGIYDFGLLGFPDIPQRMLERSATLSGIFADVFKDCPFQDASVSLFPAVTEKAGAIVIPSEHLVTHSRFMEKALSGAKEFIINMKLYDRAQKAVRYHFTLIEENPNISKSDDPEYARLLFETVGSWMDAGNIVLTPDMICRTMYGIEGSDQPSKQQKSKLDKAMDHWNQIRMNIKAADGESKVSITAHAMDFQKIFASSGGHEVVAYKMLSVPLFITQAKASGQIGTIDTSLLEITDATGRKRIRLSTERLNARTYLIRRISAMMRMKKSGKPYSQRITFDSIINAMRPGTKYMDLHKQQRSRDIAFVHACLDHFKKKGWIPSYSEDRSKKNPSIIIDLF